MRGMEEPQVMRKKERERTEEQSVENRKRRMTKPVRRVREEGQRRNGKKKDHQAQQITL